MTALAVEHPDLVSAEWADPALYAYEMSYHKWRPYRWLQFVSGIVGNLIKDGNARVIVNAHPRVGKSQFLAQWLPLWCLDRWPWWNEIVVGYGRDFAVDEFGKWIRNQVEENPRCTVALRPDSKAAGRWHTTDGGGLLATSHGGPLIGFGGHLIIVDDAHKDWADAQSPRKRRGIAEWFQGTLYHRLEPGGSIVIVQQRWHIEDLTGFLINEHNDDWTVISLPALAEANDPMGRAVGEPLCPERYDVPALRRAMAGVGSMVAKAVYQQRPEPSGAGAAYSHFSSAYNVSDAVTLRDEWPLCLLMDFNIRPGMHGFLGQYDQATDVFSVAYEIHEQAMPISRPEGGAGQRSVLDVLAQIIGGRFPWSDLQVFGDAAGSGRAITTGESCYQVLGLGLDRLGWPWRMRVAGSNPPVVDRLNAVNDALCDQGGRPHILIHPRCKRLIYDLQNNRLSEDGTDVDKSDKDRTHAGDALGYWVYYLRPVQVAMDTVGGRFNV